MTKILFLRPSLPLAGVPFLCATEEVKFLEKKAENACDGRWVLQSIIMDESGRGSPVRVRWRE